MNITRIAGPGRPQLVIAAGFWLVAGVLFLLLSASAAGIFLFGRRSLPRAAGAAAQAGPNG